MYPNADKRKKKKSTHSFDKISKEASYMNKVETDLGHKQTEFTDNRRVQRFEPGD